MTANLGEFQYYRAALSAFSLYAFKSAPFIQRICFQIFLLRRETMRQCFSKNPRESRTSVELTIYEFSSFSILHENSFDIFLMGAFFTLH